MAPTRLLLCVLTATSLLLFLAPSASAFDQRELQLFDLVEEVNANFYELLGTTRSASPPDIRRAFRKTSLLYHPDRLNNHDEATVNYFRQLNAIHEVLKDEALRLRYDEILDNGLPDWRMPVFYYRKWRKLSLFEAMLVFAVTFTVGHYLVLWGVYFERKLAVEDLFRRKSRKKQKQLEDELEPLVGPTWRDLLPLLVARGLWSAIVGTPGAVRDLQAYIAEQRQARLEAKQEEEATAAAAAEEARRKEERKKQQQERREQRELQAQQQLLAEQQELQAAGSRGLAATTLAFSGATSAGDSETGSGGPIVEGPWSETEQQLLVRAVARFPGGTPHRWEKIAGVLRRSVPDVTSKAREIEAQMRKQAESAFSAAFEINSDGAVCGDSDEEAAGNSSDDDDSAGGARNRRSRRTNKRAGKQSKTGHAVASSASAADPDKEADESEEAPAKGGNQRGSVWSQPEQSQLEAALRQYPKGTKERWERVASAVGSRSAEECAQRCKLISEKLRLKKE